MKLRPSLFTSLLLASAALGAAQSADLRITKFVDNSKPLYGSNVTFSVTAYNDGVDDATGVTVTDLLPDGYQFVSATTGSGSYDSGTGVWTIGALSNGLSADLAITAKVLTTGNYKNDATVAGTETDPDPANNTASVTPTPTWNLYWDGGAADIDPGVTPPDGFSAGGAGTWNATLKNWDSGAATTAYMAWDNSPGYTAVFAGSVGTVTLESNIAAGKLAITGTYTIATSDKTLTLNGTGTTITGNAGITISGTGAVTLGSSQTWDNTSGTMTVSAPVSTGAKLLTLNTRDNKLDVTGKISGNGGLTVNSTYTTAISPPNSSPAIPTLSNSNDYTGTTTINGFIWLNSGGLSALGADTSSIILNAGGFRLTGTGTVSRGLSLTGNCGISMAAGTATFNGTIAGAGNFIVSGNYTGGTGGAGAVVLGGGNTFSGTASLTSDGTLRLAHVNALQNATLNTSIGARSVLDLTTNNLAYNIGAITGGGALNLGTGLGGSGSGFVTIGGKDVDSTYSGALSGAAGININMIGTRKLTLSGANTHSGDTQVSAGNFELATAGSLKFFIKDSTNNRLSGTTPATVNGKFFFDFTALSPSVTSGTWNIVTNPAATYGGSFAVDGFTPVGDGTWTISNAKGDWVFNQTAGTLVLGNPTASPYDQWATDKGLTASNNGKDKDPDNDGVKNIQEFALGGDPLKGDAANNGPSAKVQDVGGSPALTLTIATRTGTSFATGSGARVGTKDGVTYTVQGGQDLGTWNTTITEIPAITAGLPDPAPSGYEYHTFKTAGPISSTPKDFIRVKVEGQ